MTKNNLIKNIVLILLYAILALIVILHHEIWEDEAQAWLVVRDLSLSGIFFHVRTEGHPLLWYILLTPFAKLHLPVLSMQIINWFFITLGAGLFLFKAPFNTLCKISVLSSSAFLYWYSAFARSYCLIPLLIFAIAIFYKKQKEHPYIYVILLTLLAHTHVVMLGFCAALTLIFMIKVLKDKKRKDYIIPIVVAILGLLACAGYVYGSQNENLIVKQNMPVFSWHKVIDVYGNTVFNVYGYANKFFISVFSIFLLFTACVLFFKSKKLLFIFLTNTIFIFSIFIFVWNSLPQRAYLILIIPVFCLWIVYNEIKSQKLKIVLNILMSITFLISLPNAWDMIKQDYKYPFSEGRNAAEFIKKNIPPDAFIVSNYPITTTPISAYLPKEKWKFFYTGYNDFYTYTIWTKNILPQNTPVPLIDLLLKHKEVYVLMSYENFYTDIEPIYSSNPNSMVFTERYKIYKFPVVIYK